MPRVWFWLQLIIGWLPFWALYTTLIMTAHDATPERAAWIALRAITGAALLGLPIPRLTRRLPWPQTFSFAFLAWHLLAASVYAASWLLLSSLFETGLHRSLTLLPARPLIPFLVVGVWLYVMVAGVSYAAQATDRAVQAEANAARAGLAALRSQLHPHFLFNAMHTVVQLIPREPARPDPVQRTVGICPDQAAVQTRLGANLELCRAALHRRGRVRRRGNARRNRAARSENGGWRLVDRKPRPAL